MRRLYILPVLLLFLTVLIPIANAEWYNPFTWNDNTYVRGEGWFLDYNSGIQKDNFNVDILDLGNGKFKHIHNIMLESNDEEYLIETIRKALEKSKGNSVGPIASNLQDHLK